jgi:peptide/nickel transport system ATP-binding protein
MHAVPRFDLQPGERLVPVREIHSEIGALIKQQATDQLLDASAPHLRVSEVSKRSGVAGGRARRMLRAGRRERLW